MKTEIKKEIEIPEGVECTIEDNVLSVKSGSESIQKRVAIPRVDINVKDGKIIFYVKKGNKNELKKIMSYMAHIRNMFSGAKEEFIYELEAVNVHFPMTLKVEGESVLINNYLGEKTPRTARILPNVQVDIKGQKVTVKSRNKEAAGQTAGNLEKASKASGRDRRIFQDGIYITSKPGGKL